MNWVLMIGCVLLVITFESSTALASAYGIAVSMTMLITTILFYFLARFVWNWSNFLALFVCGVIGGIEVFFLGSNILKFVHGGWFPFLFGIIIFTIMTTWNKGRKILAQRMVERNIPLTEVLSRVGVEKIHRNPGVAVYLSGQPKFAPVTLTLNLQNHSALHEVVLVVTVKTEDIPYVDEAQRAVVSDFSDGFYKVELHYGFMDPPNIPEALSKINLGDQGPIDVSKAMYFLGLEQLIPKNNGKGMFVWREKLFALMSRNSQLASKYFNLPAERVIAVGVTVEL